MKRNTLQKEIVSEVFSGMTNHPSAGMVYDAVHERYPSISRATVYRILAEAAEEGAIQRLKLRDANDRFDITLTRHCHVICRKCGAVSDIKWDIDTEEVGKNAESCEDFLLEECHIEFLGLCPSCRKSFLNQDKKNNL